MPKKVLLISQYFLPDINAASYRIHDLYTALKKEGFDTTVVTAYPQKFAVEEVKETANIHRLSLAKVTKKSFFSYLSNYFGFMFKSIFYSLFRLRKKKFDYVIVTSPPLFVAFGGLVVAYLKRTKLIVDIRDIWPDSAVSAGMLKENGLLFRITRKLEKFIYQRADIITCVSAPMKDDIFNKSNHKHIHVLYNGVSPDSFKEKKRNVTKSVDLATAENIDPSAQRTEVMSENNILHDDTSLRKITIGYAGNIGIVQNIAILLKVAQILEEDNGDLPAFEFLVIGDGIERERLEKEANQLGLKNITFTGTLTKQDTLKQLTHVDCLFFSLIDDPVFETTIPSKLFDYLLSNKPIITSIKGEGRGILEELGCALFFNAGDPKSLRESLLEYSEHKTKLDVAALKNKEYVITHFNREKIFKEFLQELHSDEYK